MDFSHKFFYLHLFHGMLDIHCLCLNCLCLLFLLLQEWNYFTFTCYVEFRNNHRRWEYFTTESVIHFHHLLGLKVLLSRCEVSFFHCCMKFTKNLAVEVWRRLFASHHLYFFSVPIILYYL